MGQQQLLVIVVGVIIVLIAIAVGVLMFTGHSVSSNKDGITNDLLSLGRYAYGYKLRPVPFGGGGNYYTGFTIPTKLDASEHGNYSVVATQKSVTFTAVSKLGYGSITAILDSTGVLSNFLYTGGFQ